MALVRNGISRRLFLRAGAGACAMRSLSIAQNRPGEASAAQFALVKEISEAFYRAISPDSSKLCVCSTQAPIGRMTLRVSGNRRSAAAGKFGPFSLKVLEFGSWKEIYAAQLPGDPSSFSFFASSDAVFGSSSTHEPTTDHLMAIDLRTGHLEERQQLYDPKTTVYYQALHDNILAGVRAGRELVRTQWPAMNDIVKVDPKGRAGSFRFTCDRTVLIHLVDQRLVCRRAEDFSVLWTRPVDPDISLTARMPWKRPEYAPYVSAAEYEISADGNTVAVAPHGASGQGMQRRCYLEILNAKDGTPVTRWPLDYKDGIVLSPDGKLLALGETVQNKAGQFEPTVHIYAVPSGREVAAFVHDRVPWKNRVNAHLNGGLEFTPDGRYLITSANNKIRVWQVEQHG